MIKRNVKYRTFVVMEYFYFVALLILNRGSDVWKVELPLGETRWIFLFNCADIQVPWLRWLYHL